MNIFHARDVASVFLSLALATLLLFMTSAAYALDSDGDGIDDLLDNCINVANNNQRDTNNDGFGNVCDADLNNDNITDSLDLGIMMSDFGVHSNVDADLNGDGYTNVLDLDIYVSFHNLPPGPAGSYNSPVANAGADQDVNRAQLVTLDGSTSSVMTGLSIVSYTWQQVYGPNVTGGAGYLSGVNPSFISPNQVTTVGFNLTINDGLNDSATNQVLIQVMEDKDNALFVNSTAGLDSNPGSRDLPLRTLSVALTLANLRVPKPDLYLLGDFSEASTINLLPGVSFYGGYSGFDWVRGSARSTIVVLQPIAISALSITQEPILEQLRISSSSATASGSSAYVLHIVGSTITVNNAEIVAGNGANGAAGIVGTNAAGYPTRAGSGLNGGSASQFSTSCNDSSRGLGGASAGSGNLAGGRGGNGGTMDTDCSGLIWNWDLTARNGLVGANAVRTSYPRGYGGASGAVCRSGRNGNDGVTNHGSGGLRSTSPGGNVSGNLWVPTGNGGNGTMGQDGGGGGGGGGSGGCDTGIDSYGAGGGGGGAGGARAASVGSGGATGGASFGIFAVTSTLTVTNSVFRRGNGGTGGRGGNGGYGQPGGFDGSGGSLAGGSGPGGRGGKGGDGGHSGAGAGGAGGNSYGIYTSGSALTQNANAMIGGSGGAGGPGGYATGFAQQGQSGLPGVLGSVSVN